MDICERINQAVDFLRFKGLARTHEELADTIKASRANVTAALNGNPRYLTNSFLKRFARAYSDYINEDWLVTGNGEMEAPDDSLRPHYDAKASAGFMDGLSEGKMSAEFRAIAIPMLNYDFSIDASGDSMMPRIEDGDTLLCKICYDRLNPPIGKICVIDTISGAVVKIIEGVDEYTITLHSLNTKYEDYRIELSTILNIAEVVGLVRTSI